MKKINLAVFASGAGTNFQNLYKEFKKDDLIELKLLISNNSNSGAIAFANENNIENYHISSKTHIEHQQEIINILKKNKIDLIALAGYMKKLSAGLINEFKDRILNLHPALLPKFGGKGMYGMNVHKAVIDSGEKNTGATVHLVNEDYDKGKILLQEKIEIERSDTAESIAKKVHQLEYKIYPIAIRDYILELNL